MKAKPSSSVKLLLLLVPILGTVLISGCTNTTGPTFGNGVTILNWEPSLSSVESGDNLQLRLRVQNQGELTANSVTAAITGIDPNDWRISSPTQSVNLAPPDRVQATQGETREFLFDAVAPGIPKGTTQPFTPQARVFYVYRTTASKLVTVVNDQELQRLQDQGKTLSSKDTVTSAGPLKVTINTGKFIKVKEAGWGFSRTFPITIDIQNVGGGVVSTQGMSMSANPDYKVVFSINQPGGLTITCNPSSNYISNSVTMWKGQSASVTCNVQITNTPLSSVDKNIIVTLDYSYYIDASTTVTVTGVSEGTYTPYY
jgi:hypothetical protein